MRAHFHTWECWQSGGEPNHPEERKGWPHGIPHLSATPQQHLCPAWIKVTKYSWLVAQTGWHRFHDSWVYCHRQGRSQKGFSSFLLTFQLHIFHPHYIALKSISIHLTRPQISNASHQEWVQIKETASTWSKSTVHCFINRYEDVLSKYWRAKYLPVSVASHFSS